MSVTTPGSTCERLRQKLEGLVAECVDRPETVHVEASERPNREQEPSIFFRIHSLPEDRGRIIGTQGRSISSLRVLYGLIGARLGLKVYVELADSSPSRATR